MNIFIGKYKQMVLPNREVRINKRIWSGMYLHSTRLIRFCLIQSKMSGLVKSLKRFKTYIFGNGEQTVHHLDIKAKMKFLLVGILVVVVAFAAVASAEDRNALFYLLFVYCSDKTGHNTCA